MPHREIEILLQSPIHEERMLALFVLVLRVAKCDEPCRKRVFDLYMKNRSHVNNWDLVDSSAPAIVGGYFRDRSRKPLMQLAKSASLWERRIAIVATHHFIRLGEFEETLAISRLLLADKEDLIHKAVGWMLREVGERNQPKLMDFLNTHHASMPRTMLRYAIEKLPTEQRQLVLNRDRPKKRRPG